ncbi:MAG: nickel pincer cofactor biosynthesis protein LarC [Planctomycetaceae bacterium]|nr:nickel pincer cofactor biosynthesis protein LarC [Planctomycetaceae bacterium]
MRIAYLDCSTGISGDMTLGALLDAGVDVGIVRRGIDSLGIKGVRLSVKEVVKGGFRATKVDVEHPEQHAHRHLSDVRKLMDVADITDAQRELAFRIFTAVAQAESTVHGMPIDKVHFHEVGAIDSIVDILGAAIGFDLLGVDELVCSPLPPGRGQIRIDHGICTVPAPGTAELLKGMPLVDVPVDAELTTPTGAAIVKVLADRFGPLPAMTIEQIGYGAGTKDFPNRANLLRLIVGTATVSSNSDVVMLLETNLDDVSAEIIGHTKQKLLDAGALDVYSTAVQMKKDRPGVILSVITHPADADAVEALMFAETGTFGIRKQPIERSVRSRAAHTVETCWGPVAGKLGWRGVEDQVFTPEFEDCARVANQLGLPLREVFRAALAAFTPTLQSDTPATHAHDHDGGHSHDHDHDHDGGHSHDHDHDHDSSHHHDHG